MMSSQGSRMCVSCGRSIPWDANVCPYCGRDFRYPTEPRYAAPKIGTGLRVVIYILSLLFWIVGIVLGIVFYTRQDPESKQVGKICLILGLVSVVLEIGLALLLYVLVLGFGGSSVSLA